MDIKPIFALLGIKNALNIPSASDFGVPDKKP
jgi:hypothetical protein